mmetsp:Transcript_34633/g.87645  ORF Transcript_34633/g.87645 Transcript_34633/m.87645 type:complete len:237 (+) Transcript_34633:94-804(+)
MCFSSLLIPPKRHGSRLRTWHITASIHLPAQLLSCPRTGRASHACHAPPHAMSVYSVRTPSTHPRAKKRCSSCIAITVHAPFSGAPQKIWVEEEAIIPLLLLPLPNNLHYSAYSQCQRSCHVQLGCCLSAHGQSAARPPTLCCSAVRVQHTPLLSTVIPANSKRLVSHRNFRSRKGMGQSGERRPLCQQVRRVMSRSTHTPATLTPTKPFRTPIASPTTGQRQRTSSMAAHNPTAA